MEELPRHPTGKLYKRLIRDAYWGKEGSKIVLALEHLRQNHKVAEDGDHAVAQSPFTSTILPVGVSRLAPHPNVVTAVLAGRTGPITVEHEGIRVTGDVLLVLPEFCTASGSRNKAPMSSSSTDSHSRSRPRWRSR